MTKTLLFTLACASALAAGAYDLANPALNPVERREPVPTVKPWPLFVKGREQLQILYGPGGSRGAGFLQAHFRQALGVEVACESWSKGVLRKRPYRISLGKTPDAEKAGIDPANQPRQGFGIKSFDKGLVIVGDMEGCHFGAIDFAERVLGARWYFPGENGCLVPSVRELKVGPMWYADYPRVQTREGNYYFYASMEDPAKWMKYMGLVKKGDTSLFPLWRGGGRGTQWGRHFPDPKTMAEKHPDKLDVMFYTDTKGKRWYNGQSIGSYWNVKSKAFADLMIEEYREFYSRRATEGAKIDGACDGEVVTFGTTDTPMSDEEQIAVNMNKLNHEFYKCLGERVKKEFGKKLYLLGYLNSKPASNDPTFRMPDNVEINLCVFQLPGRTRDAKSMEYVESLFSSWYRELGDRKIGKLWLYPRSSSWPDRALTPFFYQDVPKKFGKYLGTDGVFYDFAGSGDMWHYFYSAYTVFRHQWNPDWNVDAGLEAMFADLLGASAGKAMKAFVDEARADFVTDYMPSDQRDPGFSSEHLKSLAEKLSAVGKLLPKDDDLAYRRFALAADPWFNYLKSHGADCAAPAAPKKKAKKASDSMGDDFWAGENKNELQLD